VSAALGTLRGARGALTADQVDALVHDLGRTVSQRVDELGVCMTPETGRGVGVALIGVAGVIAVKAGACPQAFFQLALDLLRKAVLVCGCNCPDRPVEARVNARGGAS
jgi:hypothetical protein